MNTNEETLVTVLTPVYNGEDFLAECIESVLSQTHKYFEYLIVNNCSTDRSLEIASKYAAKDNRIRIHNNNQFVGVIENHNIAFSLMSSRAKYCKVVSADDFIFPDCIMKMVQFAEANPSVGIVGSYQLSGACIRWQGFEYPRAVLAGHEVCRQILLSGDKLFGFGTPTSIMYRSDLVRSSAAFYPNSSPHADTSACFKQLQNSAFGFVYQVLSYERTHEATQSTKSQEMNRYSSACLNDLIQYGPFYLSKEEFDRELKEQLNGYHRFLAINQFMGFREKEFWNYHKGRLKELGYPLTQLALLKVAVVATLREVLNPQQAIAKLWKRISPKSRHIALRAAQPSSDNYTTPGKALENSEGGGSIPGALE